MKRCGQDVKRQQEMCMRCGKWRGVGGGEVWEAERCGRQRGVGGREVWEAERCGRLRGVRPCIVLCQIDEKSSTSCIGPN